MWISDTAIERPVTTLILMGALLIFGYISFSRMGIDQFPEVSFPIVTVTTSYPGASPDVMDQEVTNNLEEQINTISGIKNIISQSYDGLSIVTTQFELSKDANVAAEEVRAKVDLAKQDLPNDINPPIVQKLDVNSSPILWISVSGKVPYLQLSQYANHTLKQQLQTVSGVGNVEVTGLREREIRVWLEPKELHSRGLTAADVIGAIRSNHLELPGGRIEEAKKEYSIKVQGEYKTPEGLKNLVVKSVNGKTVYLKDVARVETGTEDYRTIAHYNGDPTIGLGIRKQSGANTVAVANGIKAKLKTLSADAPNGINLKVAIDNSKFIERSIGGAQFDIILGVILTALIMFFFLRNVGITSISVISIPVSLIGGFIIMNALNFTINNLTMLAMSLAVGLVIDDTIVVLENIFRHVEEGQNSMEAARVGTSEVGFAVLAATSTVVAVFLPVAFMKGIIGRFFFQFGMAVAVTVSISLFVSFTLTPFLCSRFLKHDEKHSKFYMTLERFFKWLEESYIKTLKWGTRHRWSVIAIAIVTFVLGMSLLPFIGTEFIPQSDESRFQISFEMPTGTSIDAMNSRLYKIENTLSKYPQIQSLFSSVGSGASQEVNKGNFFVNMVSTDQRDISQQDLMKEVRTKLENKFPNMVVAVEPVSAAGNNGSRRADVQYIIQGPDLKKLNEISNNAIKDLKKDGRFVDLDTDLRLNKPEVNVDINRDLAYNLGVNVQTISTEIYALFGGNDVAKYTHNGYRYKIRVKAKGNVRDKPQNLNDIEARNKNGRLIKASNLIDYNVGQGPSSVNRYNRIHAVNLYANTTGEISAGEALQVVKKDVNKYLPDNGEYTTSLGGQSQNMQESFGYMIQALEISILVIYMVLAIQFESFIHPFTIMISLPLTMIGVFGGLFVAGATLNIFSFIGVIMLVGLVVKNAILLVDVANQQREEHNKDKVEAILIAGRLRLRPILMTAFAVIFALIPVALALSEGGGSRQPLGIAVVGGMLTSTFLTLLVIPIIYLMLDDLSEWFRGLFSKQGKESV
ncbi:MAG TPA: efflux RND transporter permease subunit [Balneolaceae bacterium]|nr:efflux RND transporter permease subunit [Balneolaceae bacterium]